MGEFQRSHSKVWWSNYVEADTEDDESHHRQGGWGVPGLVLSPSRGSSSSPSSSHKSQDSGFSDSEASSTPAGSKESFKQSPLPNEKENQHAPSAEKSNEIVEECYQICEFSQKSYNESPNKSRTENTASSETQSQTKSPVHKLKEQFISQCACLGQTHPKNEIKGIKVEGQVLNKSSDSPHIDSSSQLPVKKLREKFLQDCMCLSQESPKKTQPISPECLDKSSDTPKSSPQEVQPTLSQHSSLDCVETNYGITGDQSSIHQQEQNEHIIKEISNTQEDCVNSSRSPQSRLQSSLSRAVPVPTIRTSQRNQNRTLKESPSPNKSVKESPIPSPRRLKTQASNQSQCQNDSQCNKTKPSPRKISGERTHNLQSSSKENKENLDISVQSPLKQDNSQTHTTLSAAQRSPKCLSNQTSANESTTHSHIQASSAKEPQSNKPLSLEIPDHLGSPTHTSTPKVSSSSSTPKKLLVTPNRPVRCPGLGKKHGRPVNLLNNFNSSDNSQPEGADTERNPVQQWLGELANLYEPECMTTLQSKSLAVDLSHQVAVMAAAATDTVKKLQESTKLISTEFAKLCQQLEYGKMEHVGPLVQSLVGHVTEFLHEHCNKQGEMKKEEKKLVEVCDRLRLSAAKQPPNKEELTAEIASLGSKFTSIVDSILTQHITVLVGILEDPTSDMALRSALSSLTTLGLEGPHMSRLVSHCSGVRALLSVCLESRSSSIRTAALRALATICCVVEAIRQLEQAGGVEILSEMLSEESRPEPEVSEAAAVLAQITAPWVEDNHSVKGLSEQLSSLVHSLTRLASGTSSCETLLLSAAALANLTFMKPRTVWPLLEQGTAGKLLQAVKRRGPKVSVFLQEQAATLLANMAAVPESRPHLADQRAVVALLCFLQIRHSPLQRAPEIAAAERVQQKSAIALSRLCSDPVVAAQVIELQGVNRLVRLCKEERERNHSDGVLVACLAALRKISANCGTKVIENLDAMELVEPRLLDSFLIYSSRQESYV